MPNHSAPLPITSVRANTFLHFSVWVAAGIVGLSAVGYAKLISACQTFFLNSFHSHPFWISLISPLFFFSATAIVQKFAPEAAGSGIPQVLEAIESVREGGVTESIWKSPLVAIRTALIKVLSTTLGILGGASIGREGPTVQIASTGFVWVGSKVGKWITVDFQSFLIAGAAAGVAAAFNTPLAGITFALEEITGGFFGPFRQTVMLAVILSGIAAQAILGDYLYFGHPIVPKPDWELIPAALLIGILGGLFGGVFSRLLAFPQSNRLPRKWWKRTFFCGVICALIGFATGGDTAGSGYEVTRHALDQMTSSSDFSILFPIFKLSTTVLSYLSGMAGGIFSPSLSIGAGLGIAVAKIAHIVNFKACALIGMVTFFSGAIQAPLTGVIIVMEMTDEHMLILPFMIGAFLAQGVGKLIMPTPLYHFLAKREKTSSP